MKFTDIIKERRRVLENRMKYQPLNELKENIKRVKLRTDFKKSLNKDDDVSIICEYKPASPSLGDISQLMIGDVLPQFEEGGASAVSVLTEESYFKSNIDNLKLACRITKLPLLRKDFILDPYQIYEARAYGASAVLLMADIYPNLPLKELHRLHHPALIYLVGISDKCLRSKGSVVICRQALRLSMLLLKYDSSVITDTALAPPFLELRTSPIMSWLGLFVL